MNVYCQSFLLIMNPTWAHRVKIVVVDADFKLKLIIRISKQFDISHFAVVFLPLRWALAVTWKSIVRETTAYNAIDGRKNYSKSANFSFADYLISLIISLYLNSSFYFLIFLFKKLIYP